MKTEFRLNGSEIEKAEAFEQTHLKCAREHPTAIGGHISYEFTPTSIGTGVVIKCSLCGEQENITDYSVW